MGDTMNYARHGFASVAQLRAAMAGLDDETWLAVNGVGNLSVLRESHPDCDCGKPHFDTLGYITLGNFDLAFAEPEAVLTLE